MFNKTCCLQLCTSYTRKIMKFIPSPYENNVYLSKLKVKFSPLNLPKVYFLVTKFTLTYKSK